MDLTAIVTTKDRDLNIQYCVNSIKNCIPRPELVVVDFGSKVPVSSLVDCSWLKLIQVKNKTELFHKARAINIGIKAVKTKYLCITDADQIFRPDFFGVVHKLLQRNEKFFVMCKTWFLKKHPACKPEEVHSYFGSLLELAKKQTVKFHGDGCCNGLLTKHMLSLGGYDERYIGYGAEDSDLAFRTSLIGLKKVWVDKKTDIIHMPHPKSGVYYDKSFFDKNKLMYKQQLIEKKIKANGKNWGLL